MFRRLFTVIPALILSLNSFSQNSTDTNQVNRKQLRNVIIFENAVAVTTLAGLSVLWDEQRILLKWSFHMTQYAQYNPEQLGSTYPQRMMKDYNGQTYWLSANIRSFLHKESRFPPWLNFAAGYSGDGMIGARDNPSEIDGNPIPYFVRTG